MKNLILVRHGHYDSRTSALTASGEEQMHLLAQALVPLVSEGSSILVTSPVVRAVQSTEILKTELGMEGFEQSEALRAEGSRSNCKAVDVLVESLANQYDAVILVTHQPNLEDYPGHLEERHSRPLERPNRLSYRYGEALNIDLDRFTICSLPAV